MSSLGETLGAAPLPEFTMTLPPGWSRSAPDDATLERMLRGMRTRFMQTGWPDLHAQQSVEVRRSFRDMRERAWSRSSLPTLRSPGMPRRCGCRRRGASDEHVVG